MIWVIDDDEIMGECIARAVQGCLDKKNLASQKSSQQVKVFSNAFKAMAEIAESKLPDLIFLDVLLDGPDGFTFLNELISYEDTVRIPAVIVSSLDFSEQDLTEYGVVGALHKDTMQPAEIERYVEKYAG